MADFHQEGIITTLHALYEAFDREAYLQNLESKLEEYSHHLSICLLLPCLYTYSDCQIGYPNLNCSFTFTTAEVAGRLLL